MFLSGSNPWHLAF